MNENPSGTYVTFIDDRKPHGVRRLLMIENPTVCDV